MNRYPLRELLADVDERQSGMQMDYFVVARTGVTLWGRYKQTVRELRGRVDAVRALTIEQRKLALDIERILSRWCFRSVTRRLREIELQQKRFALDTVTRQLKTAEREKAHFYRLACRYKSILGPLDESARRALDEHLWLTKIRGMAAMDFLCYRQLREKTAELILCLPLRLRRKLIEQVKHPDHCIAWLETYDPTVPHIAGNGRRLHAS